MIRVVGTVVMDLLARVKKIPARGETVLGKGGLRLRLGGKGYNQALFAASANAANVKVQFEACVGRDQFGEMAKHVLQSHNVLTKLQFSSTESTGTGSICLEEGTGENCIVVSLGANEHLDLSASTANASNIVIGQLELPLHTTLQAFKQEPASCIRMLNAAPIPSAPSTLLDQLLLQTDVLVVNQVEAEMLSNTYNDTILATAQRVMDTKLHANALAVIVTLGKHGAFYLTKRGKHGTVPGTSHVAVDTVGAGDCFVANLAIHMLQQPNGIEACVVAANQAAGEYVSAIKPSYTLGELLLRA